MTDPITPSGAPDDVPDGTDEPTTAGATTGQASPASRRAPASGLDPDLLADPDAFERALAAATTARHLGLDEDEDEEVGFRDQPHDAVLWSALTDWGQQMAGPDEGEWEPVGPVLAEWLGLSDADQRWLDQSESLAAPTGLIGVDPEQVEDAIDTTMEPDDEDEDREGDEDLSVVRERLRDWASQVADLMAERPDDVESLLDRDGIGVEYAGVLVRGDRAWRVLEVEFDREEVLDQVRDSLAKSPLARVLDMADGPLEEGLLHPYRRFDLTDLSLAVVLSVHLRIEDVPGLLGRAMPYWDDPDEGGPQQVLEGPWYLACAEGQKGRVFSVERAENGRTMLRAVTRTRDAGVALRVADLLTDAMRDIEGHATADLRRYIDANLSEASAIAVRAELDHDNPSWR